MILDASAVIAILLKEPGCDQLIDLIGRAPAVGIGAPTLVECGIVVSARLGPKARDLAAAMIREAEVDVVPFADDHGVVAVDAFLRYGKGRHRANLNFGDCLSYAVATLAARPLLFVGEDFRHTDIEAAW
ncbi:MAG: type II toxin-antitoxin system VapC family toxin [Gemmatimonadales bacterium]|nr:type II toxin-antitoxin system VapC family toxin [Gemmatimonadales bacterium]